MSDDFLSQPLNMGTSGKCYGRLSSLTYSAPIDRPPCKCSLTHETLDREPAAQKVIDFLSASSPTAITVTIPEL